MLKTNWILMAHLCSHERNSFPSWKDCGPATDKANILEIKQNKNSHILVPLLCAPSINRGGGGGLNPLVHSRSTLWSCWVLNFKGGLSPWQAVDHGAKAPLSMCRVHPPPQTHTHPASTLSHLVWSPPYFTFLAFWSPLLFLFYTYKLAIATHIAVDGKLYIFYGNSRVGEQERNIQASWKGIFPLPHLSDG